MFPCLPITGNIALLRKLNLLGRNAHQETMIMQRFLKVSYINKCAVNVIKVCKKERRFGYKKEYFAGRLSGDHVNYSSFEKCIDYSLF